MSMHPLAALIKECQTLFLDTHGVELSYGDIARRSHGRLTRQRVQQLASDPLKELPGPDKIRGLSLGLQVPESVVLERALLSAGYRTTGSEADPHAPMKPTTATAIEAAVDAEMDARLAAIDAATPREPQATRPKAAAGRRGPRSGPAAGR